MTLEEFMDYCEMSLALWVRDFSCGYISDYRSPTEEDMKRKVMRVVGANNGCLYVVLKKAE